MCDSSLEDASMVPRRFTQMILISDHAEQKRTTKRGPAMADINRTSSKRKKYSPDPRALALKEDMAHAVDVARGVCAACGGPLDNGTPVCYFRSTHKAFHATCAIND